MNLEVAFVVDTTNSMSDDIDAVRKSLLDIVKAVISRTQNLRIRFGIVSYRDHPPQDRTYVTKVFDFTEDIKKVQRQIAKLNPSEGGDIPEAVADGLFDARTKLSWRDDAYKVLLLVGDAPPHGRDYNSLRDDYFPQGCPNGHDPRQELISMKQMFGSALFVFMCGCNPLVEESFRLLADSVEGGTYYSLLEADQLPGAILGILEGVSDLIEADRSVLAYFEAHDGVFDLAEAASDMGLEHREVKTSLSRLMELGKIPRWPKGRPLTSSTIGLQVELGVIPDAIVAGRPVNYRFRVKNPSQAVVGIRVVVSLITSEDISEVANEVIEIGPRSDQIEELELVAMTEEKGRASFKIQIFYGSQTVASEVYETRLY